MTPGSRLGPYQIVARIGAGGMGEVWRARDERLGRDVAIKVLPAELASNPERVQRYEKEARATGSLNHPNILSIYDIGIYEGSPYLVEELLEGQTLRKLLIGGPLPLRQAVEFAERLARGLAAAHDKGIVHRDLKPENVFVTAEGLVKILDFGLAKLVERPLAGHDASGMSTLAESTEAGVVLGTVGYMAPEQVRGLPCDHRTDIFALGCVLYEMLSGQRAFHGATPADTMSSILKEEPPPLASRRRSVSRVLQMVVDRCLEKRPEDRFNSAHDVALALRAISESGAVSSKQPAVASLRGRSLRFGVVLALAVVALLLAIGRPWRSSSPSTGSGAESPPSILALPCSVYGAPEAAFLADAVPQTISTLLARVEGLDIKVPPTSIEVGKANRDLSRLGKLYGVSSFIVESITASPEGFELNVQLVDATTHKVRWASQYKGPREAYSDLAHQAAEGIRLAVMPGAAEVPPATVSSGAELAMREGDYHLDRYLNLRHPAELDVAFAAYTRALEEDPLLAAAAAGISFLHIGRFQVQGEASGELQEAETWARRALTIDHRCGRAWANLSWLEIFSAEPNIQLQLDFALKAVRYSPRDAFAHMTVSSSVWSPGVLSLSLAASRWATSIDPLYLPAAGNVAVALSAIGRAEEALPFADRITRVEPDAWVSAVAGAYVLQKLGRLDEASAALAPWEPRFFDNPKSVLSQMWGQVRFELAAAELDAAMIARLEPHILPPLLDGRPDSLTLQNGPLWVCPALARLGRSDEAIQILLRSTQAQVPPPYDFLLGEQAFRPLRSDPRFAEVCAASRDGAAKIARILEDARARGELPAYLEQPLEELVTLLKENGATF